MAKLESFGTSIPAFLVHLLSTSHASEFTHPGLSSKAFMTKVDQLLAHALDKKEKFTLFRIIDQSVFMAQSESSPGIPGSGFSGNPLVLEDIYPSSDPS